MNPPEGFVPYELRTPFGVVTLPDKSCVICMARWEFFLCTACCFTSTMGECAMDVIREMNEELNKEREE